MHYVRCKTHFLVTWNTSHTYIHKNARRKTFSQQIQKSMGFVINDTFFILLNRKNSIFHDGDETNTLKNTQTEDDSRDLLLIENSIFHDGDEHLSFGPRTQTRTRRYHGTRLYVGTEMTSFFVPLVLY